MARLLADDNVPLAVVEALRAQGHDVATLAATDLGSGVADAEILALAHADGRAVLTLNRRDFFRLHREQPDHSGIVACTFDPDSPVRPNGSTPRYLQTKRCAACSCG